MAHLRFLTYNIRGGRRLNMRCNLPQVHALMLRLDIDIAVLQEVDTRPSRNRCLADMDILTGDRYPHVLIGKSLEEPDGWYGNIIASRHPITRGLVHNLETGVDYEPRNAVDALIASPYGKLRVIGTHLSLSYLERRSEARNLLRLMRRVDEQEQYPLFLMGDINEWQWRSQLLDFLDTAMTPLPCKPTFPAFAPVFKLDRAWCDIAPPVKVYAHRLAMTGIRTLSDHLPLVVDVDFGPVQPETTL